MPDIVAIGEPLFELNQPPGNIVNRASLPTCDRAGNAVDPPDSIVNQTVLAEANLQGANFDQAELMDAWLNGADLTGAVNLTCDQVELANLDRQTRLPAHLKITWTSENQFSCSE